jgi:hypothetical protein
VEQRTAERHGSALTERCYTSRITSFSAAPVTRSRFERQYATGDEKMANFVRFLTGNVFLSLRGRPMLKQSDIKIEGGTHG